MLVSPERPITFGPVRVETRVQESQVYRIETQSWVGEWNGGWGPISLSQYPVHLLPYLLSTESGSLHKRRMVNFPSTIPSLVQEEKNDAVEGSG